VIGQRIGHYEVTGRLGEGGMGEVYRARDPRLNREVAIKILPEAFAKDDDRVARFAREAQTLAALNHPNIAQIYGVEDSPAGSALVMELVEGDTLADRIARGAMAPEDAVPIALQVAGALEAAHEAGIIHRDLKPANIKVRPDGTVKVLDFGLAKAGVAGAPASASGAAFTSPAMTAQGVILGTAAYMAPEQAKGRAVDRRADIWAFGCVLFEMLTGRSPFAGDSIAETIGFVAAREPDWSALPPPTPPAIHRLLRRCLVKDSRQRLRDIGDASLELRHPVDPAAPAFPAAPRRGAWVFGAAIGAVLMAAIGATWLWLTRDPPAHPRVVRFDIHAPGLRFDAQSHPVISPDGARVAWNAEDALWVRELDQAEPRRLIADLDPLHLAWSPDSQQIAFFAKNRLWRTRVAGGEPSEIADYGSNRRGGNTPGAAWLEDGRIVFAPAAAGSGLLVVDSRGGTLQPFLDQQPGIADFHSPSPLPGNRGLLVVEDRERMGPDTISVLADGKLRALLRQEGEFLESPVYSREGFVIFERQSASRGLWAIPFSLDTLSATGPVFPVLPNRSWPSVSNDGSLLHTSSALGFHGQLALVSREGRLERTVGQFLAFLSYPRLSPDARRAVVAYIAEGNALDLGVVDMATGALTRLTFGLDAQWPQWVRGNRVLFDTGVRGSSGKEYIGVVPAEGGGVPKPLITGALAPELSPDGRWLVYSRITPDRGVDIFGQRLDPETLTPVGSEQAMVSTPSNESSPLLHPSGRFLLYRGVEAGRAELYLTRFPEAQGKWQVTNGSGGSVARWSPSGDAVFYFAQDRLLEVPIAVEPTVKIGTPRVALEPNVARQLMSSLDLTPDGKSFLVVQRAQGPDQSVGAVSVVLKWAQQFRPQ
jgi:eukaryotic-like serine/threonine-protein kinase